MEKRPKFFTLNPKIEQRGLEKVVKGPLFKFLLLLILFLFKCLFLFAFA